jgi:elongation factor G
MCASKAVDRLATDATERLESLRNIGVVAHIDAGKTTTTERILFYAGVVHKMGEVHEGNALTDWMDQERERGITITSAAVSCHWTNVTGPYQARPHQINLIDTPGHVDFTAEVERSLRVLDGAVGVFCAVAGVQPQSETVWRQLTKYQVPSIAFVNKMDRVGADFYATVDSMNERLKANAHPICLPIGQEDQFEGFVDLVEMRACIFDTKDPNGLEFEWQAIPEHYQLKAAEYREALIEALADVDDALADTYLEQGELKASDLYAAIRKASIDSKFCAVMPGSSLKNKGVQFLLESVVNYLPSPLDIPPAAALDAQEATVEIAADPAAEFSALAFKLMSDGFVGKLVFVRIYSGTLKKGAALLNPRTGKTERISRLLLMKANSREDIEAASAGSICALVGGRDIVTGDTLCSRALNVRLEPPTFPEPVISMSIEPNSTSDKDKMELGLQRLSEEDPTFVVSEDEETGQTLISGMGELHLEIIKDRLFREFKVVAAAGRPQIAYRETASQSAQAEGRFIRQLGEQNQFAVVQLELQPLEPGQGVELHVEPNCDLPKEFVKACQEGLLEAAHNGSVAGYPVVAVKLLLRGGELHETDSSELAFKMAGIFAFRQAMEAAFPVLLEPVMQVEVETPDEHQGDIIGDLNRRRGNIVDVNKKIAFTSIVGQVPLSEMFGYSTTVRSLSKGRASYSMEPNSFEPVPSTVLQAILETSNRAFAHN